VQRLIYPVLVKKHTGRGVHLTMNLNGRLKPGPDTTYIDRKEDYDVAPEKVGIFYQSASKFLPFLKKNHPSRYVRSPP
jgi:L-2-hydroxyglutarate oxidase LhgO